MNNVTQFKTNSRGQRVGDYADYVKYEVYVPHEAADDFESELLNKSCWTWLSKTETVII
jgi:hypothetical protein